ncbi:MAG: hypothetical protein ACI9GW_003438 [Halieaceae bacterium]|jgi:hypothetical protein
MPYTLDQLSDLQDIQDLILDYANAIDQKQLDELDKLFTEDAWIDYSALGGTKGLYPEVKEFLAATLPLFPKFQHFNSNIRIHLNGDEANARIYCFNPMYVPEKLGGSNEVMLLGLWYLDKYQRINGQWKISERVEEASWNYNVPAGMPNSE